MKVPYQLSGGKTIEVKANPAVAELLAGYEREDGNEKRNKRRRNNASIDELYEATGWEPTDTSVDIEAGYIAQEEKETAFFGIAQLSEQQQQLIRLRYYEGKTEREIAAILGISQPAVHKQFVKIHTALRKYF